MQKNVERVIFDVLKVLKLPLTGRVLYSLYINPKRLTESIYPARTNIYISASCHNIKSLLIEIKKNQSFD